MIKNDVQLGKPLVMYTGVKVDVEGFEDAGMVGYASDTAALGWYAGSDWAWSVRYVYSDEEPVNPQRGMIWIQTGV